MVFFKLKVLLCCYHKTHSLQSNLIVFVCIWTGATRSHLCFTSLHLWMDSIRNVSVRKTLQESLWDNFKTKICNDNNIVMTGKTLLKSKLMLHWNTAVHNKLSLNAVLYSTVLRKIGHTKTCLGALFLATFGRIFVISWPVLDSLWCLSSALVAPACPRWVRW